MTSRRINFSNSFDWEDDTPITETFTGTVGELFQGTSVEIHACYDDLLIFPITRNSKHSITANRKLDSGLSSVHIIPTYDIDTLLYIQNYTETEELGGEHIPPKKTNSLSAIGITHSMGRIRIIQVACGNSHFLALEDDKRIIREFYFDQSPTIKSSNDDEHIVNSKNNSVLLRRIIRSSSDIRVVSCGQFNNFYISEEGKCFGWGDNSNGQFGHRFTQPAPREIDFSSWKKNTFVTAVSSGFGHSAFVLSISEEKQRTDKGGDGGNFGILGAHSNFILTSGSNTHGELGTTDRVSTTEPEENSFRVLYCPVPIESISCGIWTTLILTKGGELYKAGLAPSHPLFRDSYAPNYHLNDSNLISNTPITSFTNEFDTPSMFSEINDSKEHSRLPFPGPSMLTFPDDCDILSIYAGSSHGVAQSSSGNVFVWRNDELLPKVHSVGMGEPALTQNSLYIW